MKYQMHNEYHFLYDTARNVIDSKEIMCDQLIKKTPQIIIPPITCEFYEGFGYDILVNHY